ncbi:MAG: DUF3109 family protein [Ignavibacteria bacterium]|nr:DUF3109 family protein [Ignavibacteria bacterium]
MIPDSPRYNIENLKIDEIIFTQGFVPSCNIKICKGECCNLGVYLDLEFRDKILNYSDVIIKVMNDAQVKDVKLWFDGEIIEDTDFTSGLAIGTNLYKTPKGYEQCVFKDLNNFCSLQIAAEEIGLHKWDLKPTFCILYPLTIDHSVLTYDDDHSSTLSYCGKTKFENFTQTVYNALKEEISYVFGDNALDYLNKYLKNKQQ